MRGVDGLPAEAVRDLCEQRRKHAERLGGIFDDAGYDRGKRLQYLRVHEEEQSFLTALEAELDLDPSSLLSRRSEPPKG